MCETTQANCTCVLDADVCDGRHLCSCGGSWRNEAGAPEDILLLPASLSWAETVQSTEFITALPPDQASMAAMMLALAVRTDE